jgi:hypothetical protein
MTSLVIRATLALLLALLGGLPAGDWWEDDPHACPEPEQPNCGAPNGAGGWEPDPEPVELTPAGAAEPAPAPPAYTG